MEQAAVGVGGRGFQDSALLTAALWGRLVFFHQATPPAPGQAPPSTPPFGEGLNHQTRPVFQWEGFNLQTDPLVYVGGEA